MTFAEGKTLVDGGRRAGACASAARPTPSSAAATRRRAPADRRGRDRQAGRRHGLLHVPGPRALASQPGLLLPSRRRADARHGALLHHRPRQPARPGGARSRHGVARRARRGRSPASRARADDPGRGRHPCRPARCEFVTGAVVRSTMSFDVPGAQPSADRDLRHRGHADRARPELVRRRRSSICATAAASGSRCRSSMPYADGNYRSHRRRRHGARRSARNRPHRANGDLALHVLEVMEAFERSSETRPAFVRSRRGRSGRRRCADHARRAARAIEVEEMKMREALIVWGGWNGHEPRAVRRDRRRHARGGRLQGRRREHAPRPSPIRRSTISA